ncbi:Tyrosine-protein phosphatase 69D [Chionoecetes opilio]|uniref:Tyrosine-protein phosphatase 69D n=1 Tax=Chionoecetes opilio TaxID=41210 RepID=A0A8J4XXM2_CHIOP|nr:Tyrosine-protein phosphatase 69D [Chionoecetes opilio]
MTTHILRPLTLLLVATLTQPSRGQVVLEVAVGSGSTEPVAGANVTLSCKGRGDLLQWRHGHHNITPSEERWHVEIVNEKPRSIKSNLTILHVTLRDSGHYHCLITKANKDRVAQDNITIHVQASPVLREARNNTVRAGHKGQLSCTFAATPAPEVHWLRGKVMLDKIKDYTISSKQESGLHLSDLLIDNVTLKDNGTYKCVASNSVGPGDRPGEPTLIVQDLPEVNLTLVRAIGTSQIQMEWAVVDNNSPVQQTKILIASGDSEFGEPSLLAGDQQDIILEDVGSAGEEVRVKILVGNEVGETEKPSFVPAASPKGSGQDSFTVGWSQPGEEARELVGRFHLFLQEPESEDTQELFLPVTAVDHMFTNLKPATEYTFKVAACKDIFPDKEKDCGTYSPAVRGKTLNGMPSVISDLLVTCKQSPHTITNTVHIHWKPPLTPNGAIDHYKIELKESASYINDEGQRQFYNNEHKQNVAGSLRNYTFYSALPNTNYTVKVYAGIKRQYSSSMNAVCSMPVSTPTPTHIKKWWRYHHKDRVVLRLPVPRVSERNGTICCHRVVVVKLEEGASQDTLPDPSKVPLSSYGEVHSSPSSTGAYVAEAFSGPTGDPTAAHSTDPRPTTAPLTRGNRRDLLSLQKDPPLVDGLLSSEANYTGFVIMSVPTKEGKLLTTYTDYFPIIQPKEEVTPYGDPPSSISELQIIYVAAGLFTFLLLLTFALCTLLCFYRRRNKHLEEEEVAESLSGSLG